MKYRNVDPQGAIHADALGGRLVGAGEVVEVFGEVAERMADMPATWEPQDSTSRASRAADIADIVSKVEVR